MRSKSRLRNVAWPKSQKKLLKRMRCGAMQLLGAGGGGMTGLDRTRRPRNPSGRVLAVQQATTCRRCEQPQTVVFVPFALDGDGDGLGSASTVTLRLSILHSQLSGVTKAESRGCENTVSHAAGAWCGRKSGGKVVKRAVDAGRNRGCREIFDSRLLSGKRATRYRRGLPEGLK